MDQVLKGNLCRFSQICLNKYLAQNPLQDKNDLKVALCFVGFVSVQNTVFDITNAGKKNTAFIFVIGAVKYKMRGSFCYQTGTKWI